MQAMRIIKARDHIAQAAYAAMRRVEAEAAMRRLSPTPRDSAQGKQASARDRSVLSEVVQPGRVKTTLPAG
jgi:hypothetical protein